MDGGASCGSPSMSLVSLPPSSVDYVDLYGKRRQAARVQVLEREIGLLQDEIKSLGGIELASRSCKENPMSGESLVAARGCVVFAGFAAVQRLVKTHAHPVVATIAGVAKFRVVAASVCRVLDVSFAVVV
ncbi:hypothetical protein Ccrd_005035 [Cynara cardunculus var. scolymus]|uniref:G protein gamma domain-containing protein n=1 Tax=Cynara cardunculus var. scolymus TaxID=59895 RepID=A0A103XLC2_CYNCS|nr:hypothetical protein Ccrd_005035 [Cynara cardunculus var. scolymus]